MMEVVDSHMLEQPSTFTPSSHADIDMSADYYDEEYMMHDANPTTEVVDDEEIYDAEIEEQTGHTEVEMDDYTDELIGDDETHMGTYIPADDTTAADTTVGDIHSPSPSPLILSGTSRGLLPGPDPAHTISQHVVAGAPVINVAAPTNPLSINSPQSAATLVGDPEPVLLEHSDDKIDHTLHEVIDLTTGNDETLTTNDSTIDAPDEGAQNDFELAHAEFYEEDGEEDTPATDGSPELHLPATNQSLEERDGHIDATVPNSAPDNLTTTPPDSESVEQYNQPDEGSHSPIEEALVLNQQVRDDAADTMEPSPPVRLFYEDKANDVSKIFDLFAPVDPSSESIDVLFDDNRTLFYEPLSVFFARLRETEYFSHDWQDAEMGLVIELGSYQLTITEDHKQTDDVSLFKLYFIWSGLGLGSPLRLTLQKYPSRFSVQYAQLLDHLEQRDIHGESFVDLHEVEQQGEQVTKTDYIANHHGDEDDHGDDRGAKQQASSEPHGVTGAHASDKAAEIYEGAQDARPDVNEAGAPGEVDDQQDVGDANDNQNGTPHNLEPAEGGQRADNALMAAQAESIPVPASPDSEVGHGESADDQGTNGDLYDEYDDDEYPDIDHASEAAPAQRGNPVLASDKEYDEYEELEEVNDLAPEARNGNNAVVEGREGSNDDHDSENYYDEYDANEDNNPVADNSPHEASVDPQQTDLSTKEVTPPQSPSRHTLKRNLDNLESDDLEKSGLPSPPAALLADSKRAKHV